MKNQATMEGEWFEVKLVALLFLRFKNHKEIHHFQLACNVKGAGAMDDLVARYMSEDETWRTVFTQLKHKRTKKLNEESFTMPTFFPLNKYFESSCKIQTAKLEGLSGCLFDGSYDDCEFVLYTNARVDEEIQSHWDDVDESKLRTLLSTGSDKELVFKVSKEKDADIFSSIKGDYDAVDKFLKAMTVFSGQASEDQLGDMIRRELLIAYNMTKSEVDLIYPYYRDTVKDWWRNSEDILDQDSDIVEKAMNSFQIKRLSLEMEKTSCLGFKFQDSSLLELDKSENCNMVHVVCDRLLMKIACTKLIQTLQKTENMYMFLSLDSVLQETAAVLSAWRSRVKHSLIIVTYSTEDHEDLCKMLLQHLENDVTGEWLRRIIIVSFEEDQFASTLKKGFTGKVNEIHDSFELTQLQPEYLARIHSTDMFFQEQKMTFNRLISNEETIVPGVLNDTFLQNVLSSEDISFGPKLDEDISYYIPRTLERFDVLNKSILQAEDLGDVFVLRDISAQDLLKMVPHGEKVCKVGDVRSDECRLLALETGSEEDANRVFERKENVHLVRMCPDGLLRWIRTKESIDQICRFIDRSQFTLCNPRTVLDIDGRILLVEAPPGMGKSTIVNHLAKMTKEVHPDFWVITINLNKLTGLLDKSSCMDGTSFLESAVGIDEMSVTERTLFRHSMEARGNVVVLLDGYDEIAPQFTDKGCDLLTSLSKTKAKKIVVTTRHSMRNKLEGHLSTIAFTLRQFNEENRREFFRRYWNKNNESVLLEELLKLLLTQIAQSMNDKVHEFLGIPLHAMMLAEVYEDLFINPGSEDLPDKFDLLTLFEKVIDKKFQIYLRKKFPLIENIAHEKKNLLKPVHKEHMNAALVLLLEDSQLQRLNKARKIVEKTKKFSKQIEDGNNKTGIVDRFSGGKPMFLHRKFSEYFAALWFSKNFEKNRDFLRDHMFTEEFKVIRIMFDLMLSRESELHTAVLNNNILKVTSLLASNVDVNSKDTGGRMPIHLAAALGFDYQTVSPVTYKMAEDHVIKLLLQHGDDVNVSDEVLEWSGIEYGVNTRSWDAVELMLENHPESDISALMKNVIEKDGLEVGYNEWRFCGSTLLHQAAAFGHVHIVKMFLSISLSFLHEADENGATALHEACIWNNVSVARALIAAVGGNTDDVRSYVNSRDNNAHSALDYTSVSGESLADCRHTVIGTFRTKFLERIFVQRDKEAEYDDINNSPFIKRENTKTVHTCKVDVVEIIKLLVANGSDIWYCGGNNTNPFHLACVLGEINVARALIECLEYDLALCGTSRPTLNPSHYSQSMKDDLERSSDVVVKYINYKDQDGRCALHCAAEGGSAELVNLLLDRGATVWSRDNFNATPLHPACLYGTMAAVEALTERLGGDKDVLAWYVNMPSLEEGMCPLHLAASRGCTEIVRGLLKIGADPRVRKITGDSPLVVAVKNCHLDVVRALVESIGDDRDVATYINTPYSKVEEKTVVHLCAERYTIEGFEVLRYLLTKGGDVWLRDLSGSTPLHLARDCLDRVQVLLESLGDDKEAVRRYVNLQDGAGMTAMHRAIEYTYLGGPNRDVIHYLLAKGGNIWLRDPSGSTPLHLARDCLDIVQVLVESLGDDNEAVRRYVNLQDGEGSTAMHHEIEYTHYGVPTVDIVPYLVARGGDVWLRDSKGSTPLHHARNCLDRVQVLVESLGDDNEDVRRYINMQDGEGRTALHRVIEYTYLGEPDLDVVTYLVARGGDVRLRDSDGSTPLHLASYSLDMVHNLLESLGDDNETVRRYINLVDRKGRTALYSAVEYTCFGELHLDVIHYLVARGGDVWLRDSYGSTPLHLACNCMRFAGNYVERVQALVESLGDDKETVRRYVNLQDGAGRTALHRNAQYRCFGVRALDVILYLVAKGSNIWLSDFKGSTPLHLARDCLDMVQVLVESLGDDNEAVRRYVNLVNRKGRAALHWAAKYTRFGVPDLDVIPYLVAKGGNVWLRDSKGSTPLHLACYCFVMVQVLVESLGDDNEAVRRYVNLQDGEGRTALHRALEYKCFEETDLHVIPYLVARGADVCLRDSYGSTPLHLACNCMRFAGNYVERVQALVECLGDDKEVIRRYVNLQDGAGRTVMHHAALNPLSQLTRYLITKGVDI